MADLKSKRLGGLWVNTTSKGTQLWSGRFNQKEIKDAMAEVAESQDEIAVTIWINEGTVVTVNEAERYTKKSPHGSLTIGEKYRKPESDAPAPALNTDDDIPF